MTRLLLSLLMLASVPGSGWAQAVSGILKARDGQPVAAALITLQRESGEALRATLSNGQGEFAITSAPPGRYTLRVERTGHAAFTSRAFALEPEQAVTLTLVINSQLSGLRDVRAAELACVPGPPAGPAALPWSHAARSLRMIGLAEELGLAPVKGMHYTRLHQTAVRAAGGIVDQERYAGTSTPFPALTDRDDGFARTNGAGIVHFLVPSPAVLLSPEFLDRHCIDRVLADAGGEDQRVGLHFRPVPDQPGVGIQGILWLDRATAALRSLEYEYADGRGRVAAGAAGLVGFHRDGSGLPRVSRWWQTSPRELRTTSAAGVTSTEPVLLETGLIAFDEGDAPLADPDGIVGPQGVAYKLDALVVEAERRQFERMDWTPWRWSQGTADLVRPGELIRAPQTDAYELIQSLRPQWFYRGGAGCARDSRAIFPRDMRCDPDVTVYLDRLPLTGDATSALDALSSIPAAWVGAIEYIRPVEAGMIFGVTGRRPNATIVVHSRRW